MKLFVDDIRNAPDQSWTVARTVNSAISAIATFGNGIKVISLDHDISHQIQMGNSSRPYPCDETFTAVAHYISARFLFNPKEDLPKIIIHTSNPSGAVKIKGILDGFDITIKEYGPANRLETEI